MGYGLVNTGSVGGDIETAPKDDELYVRWLELTLFLPIIQFSKVENINSLNIDSIKTLKKYQHIRKTDLIPVFEKCMMDYNQNGWVGTIECSTFKFESSNLELLSLTTCFHLFPQISRSFDHSGGWSQTTKIYI